MRVDYLVALALLAEIELQVWLSRESRPADGDGRRRGDRAGGGVPAALAAARDARADRRCWWSGRLSAAAASHQPVGVMPALILMVYGMGAFAPPRRSQWVLALLVVVSGANNLTNREIGLTQAVVSAIIVRRRAVRARSVDARSRGPGAERSRAGRAAGRDARADARSRRPRRAGADRPRAARRDRAQRLGDGDPGRRRADGDGRRARPGRGVAAERSSAPVARRWRRCAGWSGCSATARSARAGAAAWAARHRRADRGTRAAGLRADLRVDGDPAPVSPALDLCAYRIVQEALTNAIKHAGPAHAEVSVALARRRARAGGLRRRPRAGRGERRRRRARDRRACASGWRCTAAASEPGPRPNGGFAVRAQLPLTDGARAMSALRDRLAARRPPRLDAILAVAAIVELELECWLGRGISDPDRLVTAVAAVLFAAPIAVRRALAGRGARVLAAVVARSRRRSAGSCSPATPPDVHPGRLVLLGYGAGAWLEPRRSVVAIWPWRSCCSSWACPPDRRRLDDRGGRSARRCSTSRCCSCPTGWSVASSARHAPRSRVSRARRADAAAEQDARRRAAIAAGARTDRRRAPGHHRPQRQRDGHPGRRRQAAAAQRSRTGARVDPDRRGHRPRGARRPAPAARDAAQGRRPARAQPAARARASSRR